MQPRVTAILVARNGEQYLNRTLAALARQSRRPDSVVFVDAGSTDSSADLLAAAAPTQFVTEKGRQTFGSAIAHAVHVATPSTATSDDWLWLLAHDNAPEPGALRALLAAVEIAPSVAVAGPKLMRWNEPDVIASYGETITPFGSSVSLVDGELDQAQHDRNSDLLGVAASGMLVRRSVYSALGGFDAALPTVDAALDFSIRVRLAGHRIVGVPGARVASAGGPESFGRKPGPPSSRATRAAQLHRRLAYAPVAAVPLHWLSILPIAIVRAVWLLLAKHPGAIGGDLRAALAAIVDRRVGTSRRNLARNRVLGWASIAPLRMPWAQVRELRAHQRDLRATPVDEVLVRERPSFFSSGGAWIVLLLAAVGIVAFGSFLNATSLTGGGLLPLATTVGELWANVGYGWHDFGGGFIGAADPFASVLAVLGSLSFWSPSTSIVGLYLVALPLAALAAWWCAARFSRRGWAPAIAAILWALAPPFLSSLSGGHLGAVIAHLLLPWLVLAIVGSARSWAASASAAILFAVIAASAPSLVPVLVLGWLAWVVTHPSGLHRTIGIPIATVVLFAPLVAQQLAAGNLLALFADPGVPVAAGTDSGWQLTLGAPDGGSNGWIAIASGLGLPDVAGSVILAALLLPLAFLALLALFLPATSRSIPALVVALAGFVTAVASANISITAVGATTTMIWPGAGLSVFWLGLLGAVVVSLEAFRRKVAVPALVVALTCSIAVFPLLGSVLSGTADVRQGTGRLLPAIVTAQAVGSPGVGTLVLTAQPDGGLSAVVSRGTGETLDDQSTVVSTSTELSDERERIAVLAGNLASHSGFDAATELQELQIGFIVSPGADSGAARNTRERTGESLDQNPVLTAIGSTNSGYLWEFEALEVDRSVVEPGPTDTAIGLGVSIAQGLVFLIALLLAIPTSRRQRTRVVSSSDEPATTFDEEDND